MIATWYKRASSANRLQFIFLAVVCFPAGLFGFVECARGIIQTSWPVHTGDIVARAETKRWLVFPSTELTVLLDEGGETAKATVAQSEAKRIPDQVQVHYSGNSNREARLVGEESPWWGLLAGAILSLCPLIVLWVAGTWPDLAFA